MTALTGRKLAPDQEAAADEIVSAWKQSRHVAFIGPAGCGKTTTILEAIRRIKRMQPPPGVGTAVLLMAPSHKALRVLKGSWRGMRVTFSTTQKFTGVQAKSHLDGEKFGIHSPTTAQDRAIRFIEGSGTGLVIVDECSMLARDQAAMIAAACRYAGAAVVFTGDPYQLPPVSEDRPSEGDGDCGPEYMPDPSGMAPEFMDAPTTIRLSTVHRYDGPIYKYATGIRESWGQLAAPPTASVPGERSSIRVVSDWQADYLAHARKVFVANSGSGRHAELLELMPRALAYTNRTVDDLTGLLRTQLFGPRAKEQFTPGELINFPEYTYSEADVIHSSTDAVVLSSEIIMIDEKAPAHKYKTDKLGLEREIPLALAGRFQKLTVQAIDPDNTVCMAGWGIQVVIAPIIGDKESRAAYAAMKSKLIRVKTPSDHPTWSVMKRWRKCFSRINSAFVMTVHKSQGSTFRNVYVSDDICREQDRLKRNPLLYVAATRASESITFER